MHKKAIDIQTIYHGVCKLYPQFNQNLQTEFQISIIYIRFLLETDISSKFAENLLDTFRIWRNTVTFGRHRWSSDGMIWTFEPYSDNTEVMHV